LEGRRFRYARSLRRIKGNPIRLVKNRAKLDGSGTLTVPFVAYK